MRNPDSKIQGLEIFLSAAVLLGISVMARAQRPAPRLQASTRKQQAASLTQGRTDALVFAIRPFVELEKMPQPAKLPEGNQRLDKVEIAVCPGQVELGSLCVYAGNRPLKDLTIRISDLTAPAGGGSRP